MALFASTRTKVNGEIGQKIGTRERKLMKSDENWSENSSLGAAAGVAAGAGYFHGSI